MEVSNSVFHILLSTIVLACLVSNVLALGGLIEMHQHGNAGYGAECRRRHGLSRVPYGMGPVASHAHLLGQLIEPVLLKSVKNSISQENGR